jgi:hypothetical protein
MVRQLKADILFPYLDIFNSGSYGNVVSSSRISFEIPHTLAARSSILMYVMRQDHISFFHPTHMHVQSSNVNSRGRSG